MLDFIKIGFNIQEATEVFISAQRQSEDDALSYEIFSKTDDCLIATKLVNSDLLVKENINNLMNSLYKFYSVGDIVEDNSLYNFTIENLYCALGTIVVQFPFLETTQISQLEYGFNFENPISTLSTLCNTYLLFKGNYFSYSHSNRLTQIGQIEDEFRCTYISIKINVKFSTI